MLLYSACNEVFTIMGCAQTLLAKRAGINPAPTYRCWILILF